MPNLGKIVKKIPFGMIFLILWGSLLTFCVVMYLQYLQPVKLGITVSKAIEEKLNLSPKMDFIKLTVFPHPSIIIKNIELENKEFNIKVKVKEIHANISWKTILKGRPVINALELFDPDFELISKQALIKSKNKSIENSDLSSNLFENLPVQNELNKQEIFNGTDLDKQKIITENIQKFLTKFADFNLPFYMEGAVLYIRNGNLNILYPPQNERLSIEKIDLDFRLPSLIGGHLDLRLGETSLRTKLSPDIDLSKTSLLIDDWRLDSNELEAKILFQTLFQMGSLQKLRAKPIKEAYRYFPMTEPAKIKLNINLAYDKYKQSISSNGLVHAKLLLPMNKNDTSAEFKIPFEFHSSSENDNTNMLKLVEENKENSFYRQAFLKDNEKLPQKAISFPILDVNAVDIKNAFIQIDDNSLNIDGEILGLYPFAPLFQGRAVIHSFSMPRWFESSRKMSGGLHNALNNISGELDFIVNKRGIFVPKLKASVKGFLLEGLGACGNFKKPDITIKIKPAKISSQLGVIDLNPLFPEINGQKVEKIDLPPPAIPSKETGDNSNSIFVDYHIDITMPSIKAWKLYAKNIFTRISPNSVENPILDVKVGELYGGRAEAKAILKDGNNTIDAIIKNSDLGRIMHDIAGFSAIKGIINADANVQLSGKDISKILSSLKIEAVGNLTDGSFNTDKAKIEEFKTANFKINAKALPLQNINNQLPPFFKLQGDYYFSMQRDILQAELTTKTALEISTKNGVPMKMMANSAKIKYNYNGENRFEKLFVTGNGLFGFDITKNQYININKFTGTFNGNAVDGSFHISQKDQLTWTGNLNFNDLNLDYYIFGDESIEDLENASGQGVTYLPVNKFSDYALKFIVNSKVATFFGITLENFTSHFNLHKGKMILEKTNAKIKGGGILRTFLEAIIQKDLPNKKGHIKSQFKFQVENAKMEAISNMRKHETILGGTGLIQIFGNGLFQTTDDILRKLNGTWIINIQNGFFQTIDKENPKNNKDNKTNFYKLSASGTIKNGTLHNPDFLVKGEGLSIVGHGLVDLPSERIEAEAVATFIGIPEIPIKISGTLDYPVTDVKVLNAVTSTIGNITIGFFSTIKNILASPIYILNPKKTIKIP